MRRLLLIQTGGSIAVFAIVALTGCAAWVLTVAPDRPFFWYVDREIFGVMRVTRSAGLGLLLGPGAAYLGLAGALLAWFAHRTQSRFGSGLVSHMCLLLIAQPTYAWIFAQSAARAASLAPAADVVSQPSFAVLWLSIVASALSVAICHLTYLSVILIRRQD